MSQNVIQITHKLQLLEREKEHHTGSSSGRTRFVSLTIH
jgi:hypothetical protein